MQNEEVEQAPLLPTRKDDSDNDIEIENNKTNSYFSSLKQLAHKLECGEYNLFASVCFYVNYTCGSGILGIPLEFYECGYIAGLVLLIGFGILAYICYHYVIDAIIRAEAITRIGEQYEITKSKLLTNPKECQMILSVNLVSIDDLQSNYMAQECQYNLSELIGFFAGNRWRLMFDIFSILGIACALWMFAVVFGESLARVIPVFSNTCDMSETDSCRASYSLFVCLFYIWVLIVTTLNFKEQLSIQLTAALLRILVILIMTVSSIGLIYSNWYYNGNTFVWSPNTSGDLGPNETVWKWSSIPSMIAVAAYATGNQYCIPDCIAPLQHKDASPKRLSIFVLASIVTIISLYVMCGLSVSLYFGSETESPCTLAWLNYKGLSYYNGDQDDLSNFNTFIAWFVVLFPAIDLGSSFPLNAGTTSNFIEGFILRMLDPKMERNDIVNQFGRRDSNVWQRVINPDRRWNMIIRCCVCTVTCGLALIEWDFDLVISIAGTCLLLAVFFGVCVMEYYSRQYLQNVTNNNTSDAWKTPATQTWMMHKAWIYVISIVCWIAVIGVYVELAI